MPARRKSCRCCGAQQQVLAVRLETYNRYLRNTGDRQPWNPWTLVARSCTSKERSAAHGASPRGSDDWKWTGAGHFVHTVISAPVRSLPKLLDSGFGDFALCRSPSSLLRRRLPTWRPEGKALTIDRLSNLPLLRPCDSHVHRLVDDGQRVGFPDGGAVLTGISLSRRHAASLGLGFSSYLHLPTCPSHSVHGGGGEARYHPCQRPAHTHTTHHK